MRVDWQDEPKVKVWKENIARSGCFLHSLEALQLVHTSKNELLFALCKADVATPEGKRLPPILLIRGNVIIVVPLVRNRDTGEERFITVIQHRIGTGAAAIEFPAGMMDRDDDPLHVATEEFREETDVVVAAEDLFRLHDGILYTSPGLQDEGVHYFGCLLEMTDADYRSLEGRKTGEKSEGESIIVSLKTEEEIMQLTNAAQVILGLLLFKTHTRATL
jgi:hypothetical protein